MLMEHVSPLQGGLGYLLAGEIVVVTGLTLTLIKMMMNRLRAGETPADVPKVVSVTSAEVPSQDVEKTPQYLELLAKIQAMEVEKVQNAATGMSEEEANKLREKIGYLENKLVEYEIVQEEIGALGDLKAENEKLKTELMNLKSVQIGQKTETLINEQFKDFGNADPAPAANPMPGELQTLLSDIDTLAQTGNPEKKP
ncbi:MAG: hypothetical protein EBQ85_03935 [Proteobacteria bacterium]|nr:hypothetical protein [Pseudomonadota bacterium]